MHISEDYDKIKTFLIDEIIGKRNVGMFIKVNKPGLADNNEYTNALPDIFIMALISTN